MKYIMIETTPQNAGERRFIPFIFPKELVHKEVAAAMLRCLGRHGIGPACVRSAGEVATPFERGAMTCHGESETLGVKAHADDTDIVRLIDYHHGLADSIDMTCVVVDSAVDTREAKR